MSAGKVFVLPILLPVMFTVQSLPWLELWRTEGGHLQSQKLWRLMNWRHWLDQGLLAPSQVAVVRLRLVLTFPFLGFEKPRDQVHLSSFLQVLHLRALQ